MQATWYRNDEDKIVASSHQPCRDKKMDFVSQITTRIPKLEQSWCGCSLHTGTKIIGIFSVLAELLMVVLLSVACGLYPSASGNQYDDIYRATLTIIVASLITSVCDLMVSILLVMAAYTERPNLAKPWLVVSIISISMDVIVFIAALAVGDVRIAITTPIRIGFGLYFWLVVYNYVRDSRGEPLLGSDHGTERVEEGPLFGRYQM